jgi:hypothetical protein
MLTQEYIYENINNFMRENRDALKSKDKAISIDLLDFVSKKM